MDRQRMDRQRMDQLTSWDAPWSGLRVLVTGIGVAGFSVADTLVELGARVTVFDTGTDEATLARVDTLRIIGGVFVHDQDQVLRDLDGGGFDLLVTSPGWAPSHPVLAAAQERGVPVWGDAELAWRVREREGKPAAPWLVVTGTNGKTTTVGMLESILRAAGLRALAVGNIGTPILDAIREPEPYDVLAVELSSFQLHWSRSLSPEASVCLNIAEDHTDWHGGFEGYRAAKAKVYENTRTACVYNVEQEDTERMVEQAEVVEGARAVGFTLGVPAISMLGVVEDILCDRAFTEERRTSALELARFDDLGVRPAPHTVANALAAAALARAIDVPPSAVREGLRAYRPAAHRMETVGETGRVLWVNDSKATNPHAAAAALSGFSSVVWVAGGDTKGVDIDALVAGNAARIKAAVLLGRDRDKFARALERHAPQAPVALVAEPDGHKAMDAAVAAAAGLAAPGDTVLLAPAAASLDQFGSYAERGEAFAEAVARHEEDAGARDGGEGRR